MPQRIQRKRTKGWKMPENTVYVGRPSRWGNPFEDHPSGRKGMKAEYRLWLEGRPRLNGINQEDRRLILETLHELRGKDLACWCPLDQPCHADVLLELANRED